MFTDELDEFVASVPADLKVLPELGIQTNRGLELFVAVPEGSSLSIESTRMPLALTLGEQTDLFQRCLPHVTDYDLSDYGHESSRTLQVLPAPPYSDGQRREFHVLLSRLARAVGGVPNFWSRDFAESEENDLDPFQELADAIESWRLDDDRAALSLANKAAAGTAQGAFINVFRLLELVLRRATEDELEHLRFDRTVSSEAFIASVRSLELSLADSLRRRVRSLSRQPEDVLRKLWTLLVPTRGYSSDEIFTQIARLRNLNVHRPTDEEVLRLPWEEPPFDRLTALLAVLVAEVISALKDDAAGRAT